jgi:hypothetical protein
MDQPARGRVVGEEDGPLAWSTSAKALGVIARGREAEPRRGTLNLEMLGERTCNGCVELILYEESGAPLLYVPLHRFAERHLVAMRGLIDSALALRRARGEADRGD